MSLILFLMWLLFGWVLPESAWGWTLLLIGGLMVVESVLASRHSVIVTGVGLVVATTIMIIAAFMIPGGEEVAKQIVEAPGTYGWSDVDMALGGFVAGCVVWFVLWVMGK